MTDPGAVGHSGGHCVLFAVVAVASADRSSERLKRGNDGEIGWGKHDLGRLRLAKL